MLVLAGPFCLRDGLDYTPLEQALEHAAECRPQVLVLMGPFLDASNIKVQAGETVLPDAIDPSSFAEVYARLILPKLVRGLAPLRRASFATEVLLVPSLEEVLHFHPMPQPGLDAELMPQLNSNGLDRLDDLRNLGVRFLSNPAHMRLNGHRVTLTSADALGPVVREIVLRPEGKKLEEGLRALLWQRNLFPVVPRDPAHVSEVRAAALNFPGGQPPDICIFPSGVGNASGTVVDETLFLNPGSVCRPAALGTFAEVWIAPEAAGNQGGALGERICVDMLKLSSA